jgi:hypothetical protein
VFRGAIVADPTAHDTLELAGTVAGTLSGLGHAVTGFANITEDANAIWTLNGTVSGAGTLALGGGATLTLGGTISIGTIAFAAGGALLTAEAPHALTSTFSGFGTGDVIDLANLVATSFSYANNTLTLFNNGDKPPVDLLTFAGNLSQSDFTLKSDGHGGTDILHAGAHAWHNPDRAIGVLSSFHTQLGW